MSFVETSDTGMGERSSCLNGDSDALAHRSVLRGVSAGMTLMPKLSKTTVDAQDETSQVPLEPSDATHDVPHKDWNTLFQTQTL